MMDDWYDTRVGGGYVDGETGKIDHWLPRRVVVVENEESQPASERPRKGKRKRRRVGLRDLLAELKRIHAELKHIASLLSAAVISPRDEVDNRKIAGTEVDLELGRTLLAEAEAIGASVDVCDGVLGMAGRSDPASAAMARKLFDNEASVMAALREAASVASVSDDVAVEDLAEAEDEDDAADDADTVTRSRKGRRDRPLIAAIKARAPALAREYKFIAAIKRAYLLTDFRDTAGFDADSIANNWHTRKLDIAAVTKFYETHAPALELSFEWASKCEQEFVSAFEGAIGSCEATLTALHFALWHRADVPRFAIRPFLLKAFDLRPARRMVLESCRREIARLRGSSRGRACANQLNIVIVALTAWNLMQRESLADYEIAGIHEIGGSRIVPDIAPLCKTFWL